ncbi:MAG: hypothetical protein IT435_02460 [Phycisphaerales bacterium]|nr:hypothetical protein [Phycisphaerales bacterium]
MRVRVKIVNPAVRTQELSRVVRHFGFDTHQASIVRLAMTPDPLHFLPDHSARGRKSLGRIQQLRNRARFDRRARVSR